MCFSNILRVTPKFPQTFMLIKTSNKQTTKNTWFLKRKKEISTKFTTHLASLLKQQINTTCSRAKSTDTINSAVNSNGNDSTLQN